MKGVIVAVLFGAAVTLAGCGPRPPATTAPPEDVRQLDAPGLHNLFRVTDRVYSGSGPENDAAFAALQKLGIRTIISVDGATPDVAAAKRYGLRYVHLPVGYDGIPRDKVLALAATADLPGPVYVHCHHGKHRGPAAVAILCRAADGWAADQATAWMKQAGTDPRYAGLFAAVETFAPPTPAERVNPADLPAVAPVPDFTRMMVEIDARWDHLNLAKAAGWKPPADHPDVAPPHEALQLLEHFREAGRLDSVKQRGPEFVNLLADAVAAAENLEAGLRIGDGLKASAGFARSAELCASCHGRYRDPPGANE